MIHDSDANHSKECGRKVWHYDKPGQHYKNEKQIKRCSDKPSWKLSTKEWVRAWYSMFQSKQARIIIADSYLCARKWSR